MSLPLFSQYLQDYRIGDVTFDKVVDIADVNKVVNIVLGKEPIVYPPSSRPAEAVELGLPSGTKWASYNLGAKSPEQFGDYYGYAETFPRTSDIAYRSGFKKYFEIPLTSLQSQGVIDESGNLTKEFDVANLEWGDDWKIPSKEQFQELIDNCTWTPSSLKLYMGFLVTGPNGKSIFLPCAGVIGETDPLKKLRYMCSEVGEPYQGILSSYTALYGSVYINDAGNVVFDGPSIGAACRFDITIPIRPVTK